MVTYEKFQDSLFGIGNYITGNSISSEIHTSAEAYVKGSHFEGYLKSFFAWSMGASWLLLKYECMDCRHVYVRQTRKLCIALDPPTIGFGNRNLGSPFAMLKGREKSSILLLVMMWPFYDGTD